MLAEVSPFIAFCFSTAWSAVAWAQPYAATVSVDDAPPGDGVAVVSVIDLSRPDRQGAGRTVSLAEVIAGEPGVHLRATGGLGQFSGALLRGAESSQVAIFMDGVPLGRGGQSAVDLSSLPVDGLERVEVYRGLPPLSFGADAIGGAINLVTRRGGTPSLRVIAGGGSFGLRKLTVIRDFSDGGLRGAASVSYQGATGDFPYFNTGGLVYQLDPRDQVRRQDDGFDEGAADVRLSYEVSGFKLHASAHGLLKRQGVPGIGDPRSEDRHPSFTLGRALLAIGFERGVGPFSLATDLHGLLERSDASALGSVTPLHTEGLSGQVGGQILARLAPRADRQWLFLAEARREDRRSTDLCSAPRTDCDAQGSLTTRSARTRVTAGLSFDLRILGDRLLFQPAVEALVAQSHLFPTAGKAGATGVATDATTFFPSPRIGVRLRLSPWLLLRTSAGRFVRLPTFLELFGDGLFFRDNLTLRPESAWSLETGLRAEVERRGLSVLLETSGFYRLVDDLIQTLHDGPNTLSARNVGSAHMEGLEAEVRGAFRDRVSLRLNYTLLDSRDFTDVPGHTGNVLPGRPRHTVFLRFYAGHGPWRAFYELDHSSSLYLDPANLNPRPGLTLHGVGVSLGPTAGFGGPHGARFTLSVELRNLLDARILLLPAELSANGRPGLVPLSDYNDYPLPGRSFYATLSAQL